MDTTLQDMGDSPRVLARHLYWMGWRVVRIAELIGENTHTVHNWKRREGWDEAAPATRVNGALEARMIQLIIKEQKEGKDFKELDLLGRQFERMARIDKFAETGKAKDLNPKLTSGPNKPKNRAKRNALDDQQIERVSAAFWDSLFAYQRGWYRAGMDNRIRNILKSRQIGATWYFAREAITDALETGKNKIFLSASKAQAHIFRNYIVQFVLAETEVELKGDPIVLGNGASLYFLGTNSKTAQGYHGDVYLDEYFWIQRFQEFRKVVSGMAMHSQWRQTYFSTPSSIAHEAYPFWTGELFNRGRKRENRIEVPTSHDALKEGRQCRDGHWRQIVTVEDAIAGGCDLFDLDQLRMEYSPEEFSNLLMCEFIDDSASAFPLETMDRCLVDSWEVWSDFRPFAPKPLGDEPAWLGYDPNGEGEGGDPAGVAIIAPPTRTGGTHRIVERHKLPGRDYEWQAEFLRECANRFNVVHIGIDTTGLGDAVAQLVAKWFPTITRYRYTPELKAQMVMQAQQIMRKGRLEFDAGWRDLVQSFMAIRHVPTASGRAMTYKSGRSSDIGHAELAWAVMHALHHEPIDGTQADSGSILEISE
jgi:uncharacterized protein YjcR